MQQYGGTCAAAGIGTNSVAVDMQNQMNAILKYNKAQGSSNVAELNAQPDPVTAADFYSQVFERPVVQDSDVRPSVAQSVFAFLTGMPIPPPPPPPPGQEYTIRSGDTLNSIAAAAYGAANADAGVAAIEAANPGINANDLQIGQEIMIPVLAGTGAPVPGQEYTIRSGDTLNSIAAAAYGAANADAGVAAIEAANPGINANDLQIGQEIMIPVLGGTGAPVPGQEYTIRSGDTLNSIAAAAYGAANADAGVAAIEAANPGINANDLQIGQQIMIPVLGGTGAPVPGQEYTIRSGDTLNSIAAAAYGAANADAGVAAIEAANPGIDANDLQIGQEIMIPVLGGTGDQFQAAILAY